MGRHICSLLLRLRVDYGPILVTQAAHKVLFLIEVGGNQVDTAVDGQIGLLAPIRVEQHLVGLTIFIKVAVGEVIIVVGVG